MLQEGSEVGPYVLETLVGSGGTAQVFRARHQGLRTIHAVKVLHASREQDPVARERFLKEGQVLAELRHPALVHVTDVVYDDGVAALVMDHLEGRDLSELLADGPLGPEEAADILLQVLSGMSHAHRARVFHRDLKPANLFLVGPSPGRAPFVKVLDFGIAKVADSFVTRAAATLGTVPYMSPEQIDHPGQVDARSDVFSLGAVLFEIVAGYRPFTGESDFEIMQRIKSGEHRPLPANVAVLQPIIDRALKLDPNDRFPTADAFADALRPFASPEVRERIEVWVGTGDIDVDALDAARDELTAQGRAASRLAQLDATVVRRLGALQLFSGVFNLTVMSAIQCFGIGLLGGLPACFAGVLIVVGVVEVVSGIRALVFRDGSWLQMAAWFELVSLSALGVVSTAVGVLVLVAGRPRRLEA